MGRPPKRTADETSAVHGAGKMPRSQETERYDCAASSEATAEEEMSWLYGDESATGELMMKMLDEGAAFWPSEEASAATSVTFIQDPYSPPLICKSSSSYFTINCNEETCGSSFSDLEASAMVSVDTAGIDIAVDVAALLGRMEEEPTAAAESSGAGALSDATVEMSLEGEGSTVPGSDGGDFDWDDEMLARFLGELD